MFYVVLDGIPSTTKRIVVTKRPNIPAPEPNYTDTEIPGIDGSYVEFDETYKDIPIEIEFNYITNPDNWHNVWRNIKRWLLRGKIREMQFSDDLSFFYRVKKVILNTNEREFNETGKFTAVFTVAPYEYLTTGKFQYTAEQCKINQFDDSLPNYIIRGEGMCTLTINGNSMTANISEEMIINTQLKIAYRDNDGYENVPVTGDFDDLKLVHGNNTILISDGFELLIEPNWRCL